MSDTSLIIIDMQLGNFLEPNPVYEGSKLLLKVESLIIKARSAQIPIMHIQHKGGSGDPDEYGTQGYEIHPSIKPVKGDVLVQKQTPDAFHGTNLKHELDIRGIKKLVITGLQTEYCVDTTCRRSYSLGYDVVLVKDAHSTWDSGDLSAQQIIDHHNNVLGGWFVTLKNEADIYF